MGKKEKNMAESKETSQSGGNEIEALKDEVKNKTPEQIREEFLAVASQASELKQEVDANLVKEGKPPAKFEGEATDKQSSKGKAVNVREVVQKVLIAGQTADKIPTPEGKPVEVTDLAKTVIQKISVEIKAHEVTEQSAPYLYQLLYKVIQGEISDVDSLAQAFQEITQLQAINPYLFKKLQNALVEVARSKGFSEDEAKKKFINEEIEKLKKREESSSRQLPTFDEFKRFDRISKKINDAMQSNLNLPVDDPNKITGDQRFSIIRFIAGDETVGDVSDILQKLGLSPDEINEFISLQKKLFYLSVEEITGHFVTRPDLKGELIKAIEELKIENLFKEDPETGRPVILEKDEKGNIRVNRAALKNLIKKYYQIVLDEIHKNHTKSYQDAFQDHAYTYSYYFAGLRVIVLNTIKELEAKYFRDDYEMKTFFDYLGGRFISGIQAYAEIFHNLPLYAKDFANFEKWSSFFAYLYPSELAEVFKEDPLMEIARSEMVLHLRKRIALNGNIMPSDLFGSKYDAGEFRMVDREKEELKKRILTRAKELGLDPADWEVRRALTYAPGIGLATLVDPEIIATADPTTGFEGIYPLSVLFGKHNWGTGRGGQAATFVPEILAMDVKLYPESGPLLVRLGSMIFKGISRAWNPQRFQEKVSRLKNNIYKSHDRLVWDFITRDGRYQDLLNMISIPVSLISRDGWRFGPIQKEIREKVKNIGLDLSKSSNWTREDWRKFNQLLIHDYGSFAVWWLLEGQRFDGELMNFLSTQLGRRVTDLDEWRQSEKAFKKLFTIAGKKYNFIDVETMLRWQLRGEVFYLYLRRNPGDFLMLLSQLAPDILKKDGEEHIFLSDEAIAKMEEGKRKLLEERRRYFMERWGREGFKKLKEIRSWIFSKDGIGKLIGQTRKDKVTGRDIKIENIDQAIEFFLDEVNSGFNKARNRSLKEKERKERDWGRLGDCFLKEEDIIDPIVREIIFQKGGLFELLPEEDFGGLKSDGRYDFGKPSFFFSMGKMWTFKQNLINPFSADVFNYEIFRDIAKVGEDVLKRLVSDPVAVKKMLDGITHLDLKLLDAAISGDLKEIYEIHDAVFKTLKGTMGLEYAQRANTILASIVAQFFWEDSRTRIPFLRFPFDIPTRLLLGKKISLSKLVTNNWHAFSMDTNGVRDYFMKLAFDKGYISVDKGMWSYEHLFRAFDAKSDTYIIGDALPSFGYFLIMFLLFSYIKKALEEIEGKK